MKNNNLIQAGIVSVFFLVFKFIEMKIIIKENIPPKQLLRDTLIVFISVLLGKYLLEQFENANGGKFIEVFTDSPAF
jgi:hypothetical protein